MYNLQPPPIQQRRGPNLTAIVGLLGGLGCLLLLITVGAVGYWLNSVLLPQTAQQREYEQHRAAGDALYAKRRYRQALSEYSGIIRLYPNYADGYYRRGMAYYMLRDGSRGIQDFTSAVQLYNTPYSKASAYLNRGLCFELTRDWSRAVDDFTRALQLYARLPRALVERGGAYERWGKIKEAETDFTALIRYYPEYAPYYEKRAELLNREKEYSRAVEDSRKAVDLDSGNPVAWGNLGWAEYLAGNPDAAMHATETCLKMDGSLVFARLNCGLIHAVGGDWPAARSQYMIALKSAGPHDISAGLDDVESALKAHSNLPALRQAEALLRSRQAGSKADTTEGVR